MPASPGWRRLRSAIRDDLRFDRADFPARLDNQRRLWPIDRVGACRCTTCPSTGESNASIWAFPPTDLVLLKSAAETFIALIREYCRRGTRRFEIVAPLVLKAVETKRHSTVFGWRLIECLCAYRQVAYRLFQTDGLSPSSGEAKPLRRMLLIFKDRNPSIVTIYLTS